MGKDTEISWSHHTFNPWWGCLEVSPACKNCYAKAWAKRTGHGDTWGNQGRRRFFGDRHWNQPLKWNRAAEQAGERHRVFCGSMCDVFEELPDDHPDRMEMAGARLRLWVLIQGTPHLDWLLLTKRPENIAFHVPWRYSTTFLKNVWLGTTVETQEMVDRRVRHLLRAPAREHFLSGEPLLGPVELAPYLGGMVFEAKDGRWLRQPHPEIPKLGGSWHHGVSWVIGGGESGGKARPMNPEWVRSLRDQCQLAGVAFHFKQWGAWGPDNHGRLFRLGKKKSGRELDGRSWDEIPANA